MHSENRWIVDRGWENLVPTTGGHMGPPLRGYIRAVRKQVFSIAAKCAYFDRYGEFKRRNM